MRTHSLASITSRLVDSGLGNIVLAWATTRGALLGVGLLSLQLLPSAGNLMTGNLRYHTPRRPAAEIWARWDSEWYLLIAERGYAGSGPILRQYDLYHEEDASGFFPLYPLLVRTAGGMTGDPVVAGILVSNLCLLAAAWFLTRMVRHDHGDEAARWAPWVLFAFPTGLFLSAVYAESLFLMLAIGTVWQARRGRWGWAGILGGLACLTRPLGFLLIIPVGWELWRRRDRDPIHWAPVGLMPLGTVGFLGFCQLTYGDFLAPLHRQLRWRGAGSGPWRAFVRFLEDPEIHGAHHSVLELAAAVLVIAAIPLMFRTLRPGDALYGALAALAPLCTSLWSFGRLSLAVYPLFLLLAMACGRWRGFPAVYLGLSLPFAALFMAMFAGGWWVG
jgi:hypothetical protein